MKYKIKLHETKLKLESERKEKLAEGSISKEACSSQVEAKLPKLVISKFDGDFMDWQRFWGQFNESIEKLGLASIAKFSSTGQRTFQYRGTKLWNELNKGTKLINNLASFKINLRPTL